LQKSDVIPDLCESYRLGVTENRRSDPQLFDFIQSRRPGMPEARDLAEALADTMQCFFLKLRGMWTGY
jgi:hypothetical protein